MSIVKTSGSLVLNEGFSVSLHEHLKVNGDWGAFRRRYIT